jgi:hypothetical protein
MTMDARTLSRLAGATSLIVGPLVLAIPIMASDNSDAPAATRLRDYANHPTAALVSNLFLLALILLVPAMIYAARLARPGAPKLAFVGGGMAALGWLAGLMSIGAGQIALYQGSKLADQAGAAALIDRMDGDPVFGALVGIFVIGHVIGMIILGVALWRSRAVARWAAGLFIAYPILHFAAHQTSSAIDVVAGLLLLVSGVAIAVRILRTPDRQWDLPAGRDAGVTEAATHLAARPAPVAGSSVA